MHSADLLRTPLERVHRELGAKIGAFAGWAMPIEYEGSISEHRAVRERVGMFDLSHLGKVDVSGPGALPLLQRTFTHDRFFLVPNASNTAKVVAILREQASSADVVEHAGWCFLGVQGPRSPEVVGRSEEHTSELQSRGHLVCR